MDWQIWLYLFPYLASFAISMGVGLYAWRRRAVAGVTAYAISALGAALWTSGFILELLSPTLEAKIFWDNIQFIAVFIVPVAGTIFALEYTGRKLAHRQRTWALLSIVPALSMLLIFTDAWHHLIRPTATLVPREPAPELLYDFSTPVLIMAAYAYGLTLVNLRLLLGHLIRQHRLYRIQTGLIMLGVLVPFLGTVITLIGISLGPYRDIFPLTSGFGNLLIAWGLFRFRLFDLIPVAREAVIESMSDLVIVLDVNDRVVDINLAALKMIGRTAAEVIGQPTLHVFSQWPELVDQYRNVEQAHAEVAADFPDGRRYFDLRLSPVRDQSGQLIGRLVVSRDITEQKVTEAALRRAQAELEQRIQERTAELSNANAALEASERKHRALVENAVQGILIFKEGRIAFANPAMAQIADYTVEELTALSPEQVVALIHPEDQALVSGRIRARLAGEPALARYEFRVVRKDQAVRWLETQAALIEYQGGTAIQTGVVDITERKRAEEALRESEERFRSLTEASFEGLMIHAGGVILDANQAFADLFGYPLSQLIGRNGPAFMLTPESQQAVREHMHTGTPGAYEVTGIKKDGATFPAETQGRDIQYKSRRARVVAMRDITERKQAEAAVQRYAERMEILHEIDRAILATDSPEGTALAALTRLRQLLPGVLASVTLFDFELNQGWVLARSITGEPIIGLGVRFPLDTSEHIERLRQGQWITVADVLEMPQRTAFYEQKLAHGVRSCLVAPLRYRDVTIGALNLDAAEPGSFHAEHLEIAREVADQLAIAIQQARLFAQTTEALAHEHRLNEITRVISGALDIHTLIPTIIKLAAELVDAEAGSLALIAPDGESLTTSSVFNGPASLTHASLPRGQGLAWHIVGAGAPLLLDDYAAHPGALSAWAEAGFRAFIGAPIMAGETCLGVLGLFRREPRGRFTPRDMALVESVGRQAGIAIQNARLFDAEKRNVALLTALHDTGLDLSAQLELPVLLRTIIERAARLLEAAMGSLYLLSAEGQTLELAAGYNLAPEHVVERLRLGEGLAGLVAQTGKPRVVVDYLHWAGRVTGIENAPYRGALSVPITWQGQVLGAINVLDTRPARFGPGDVEAVRLFAAQAAIAIQNARLFQAARRQVTELTVLHATATACMEVVGEDALLERVTAIIGASLYSDNFGFLLTTPEGEGVKVHPSYHYQDVRVGDLANPVALLGQGVTGRVALSGQPLRLPDVAQDPNYLNIDPRMRSEVCVPIKLGERVIGVINAESMTVNAFSEADERLLLTVAGQLATALERLRARAEIIQLNAKLEQRVQERTTELAAANKELEAFSYSVSHDLRAPLRSLDGFSRILLEEYSPALDAQGQEHLQRIRHASQRMGQLIDNLLHLARITRAELRRASVDLTALARDILAELQAAEPERQVEVSLAAGLTVHGDARLLRVALTNLLGNAWKFTGKQAQARIEFGVLQAHGERAYYVRDNGAGFDMAYAQKLFGAFQRLHTESEFPGTGIGLAIVQRVILRHGGRLWAESAVGAGAAFFFTLPFRSEAHE